MSADKEALPGGFVREDHVSRQSIGSTPQLSSKQEGKLIHYVDQKLLEISRLYKRRAVEESEQAVASEALDQLLSEISSVLNILAQVPEGSSSIVIAYALNILDIVSDYIRVFNRSPETTFACLEKLDQLFVSLIDRDRMSMTEQTRLSGLAARLRNIVYTKYEGADQYESQCSQVLEGTIALL